jgi:predicted naringenin-chalcone synthase
MGQCVGNYTLRLAFGVYAHSFKIPGSVSGLAARPALASAMFVIGLGTAVPPNRYTQRECFDAFQTAPLLSTLQPRSRALLRKVLLGVNGIGSRHLALTSIAEAFDLNPDTLHARFARHAPALATQAAERALADAICAARDIDALVVSTCTGYLCPGLTSYVAERLSLPADLLTLDLVGQGCGAALPNLRAAEALLAGGGARSVLSVCVEVCSAAPYFDDDPGVLISACLFGDGAGAAVLSREPAGHSRRVEWKTAVSVLKPAHRDQLRFEQRGGLLRNILTVEVPAIAAQAVAEILDQALAQASVSREEIRGWMMHAGGRDVLDALRLKLGLTPEDLRWSSEVLRDHGNMSSPSVYFTLQRALAEGAPAGWWWLCSFGAGFSCHGALLQVE